MKKLIKDLIISILRNFYNMNWQTMESKSLIRCNDYFC